MYVCVRACVRTSIVDHKMFEMTTTVSSNVTLALLFSAAISRHICASACLHVVSIDESCIVSFPTIVTTLWLLLVCLLLSVLYTSPSPTREYEQRAQSVLLQAFQVPCVWATL